MTKERKRKKRKREEVSFSLREKTRILCVVERKSWRMKKMKMMMVVVFDVRADQTMLRTNRMRKKTKNQRKRRRKRRCVAGCTIRRRSEDKEGSLRVF